MRILLIASSFDSQTMRWIDQIRDMGWDIHLFDRENLIHPQLRNCTVHTGWQKAEVPAGVKIFARYPLLRGRHWLARCLPFVWERIVPPAPQMLAQTITKVKPDIIHIHGSNPYGYWFKDAYRLAGDSTPWIYSNKGSDIYYWGKVPNTRTRLRELLGECPYYLCNCPRDLDLASQYGFNGKFMGYFQGSGGYPIDELLLHRQAGPVAKRKIIAVKGLQHFVGRALVAFEALEHCCLSLKKYKIVVFQAHPEVRQAARDLKSRTGLETEIFERSSPAEFYDLLGRSRLAIGVSISDGIPNSMLEAMIMGAFPIQTNPGGATEYWIKDGKNGFLIPPEDPIAIAEAVQLALERDELVNAAAEINLELAEERLDISAIREHVHSIYLQVFRSGTLSK